MRTAKTDHTGRMPRLICLHWAHAILLVLLCADSYLVVSHYKCLDETLLMSTCHICCCGEIKKIIATFWLKIGALSGAMFNWSQNFMDRH